MIGGWELGTEAGRARLQAKMIGADVRRRNRRHEGAVAQSRGFVDLLYCRECDQVYPASTYCPTCGGELVEQFTPDDGPLRFRLRPADLLALGLTASVVLGPFLFFVAMFYLRVS